MINTTSIKTPEHMIGMGQIALGESPQTLKAVVGSCIALVLYHPQLKRGAMAHIVLPNAAGRTNTPGKFADTAIPHMLELMKDLGLPHRGLTAKFAGGANMFNGNGPMQIGKSNAETVAQALQTAGIRIAGQDVGGSRGRRVIFDCTSGVMTIECAGLPAKSL